MFSILNSFAAMRLQSTMYQCYWRLQSTSPPPLAAVGDGCRRILLTYFKVEFYCNKGLASAGRNLAPKELINLNVRRQLCCSSEPAEAVTIAILNCASFHTFNCLIGLNRKVKSFKRYFYRNNVRCKSYNKCPKYRFLASSRHRPTIVVLSLVYYYVNCTLFEVSPDVRCFKCVKSLVVTVPNGGLSRLHSADEDAVLWLTSYG